MFSVNIIQFCIQKFNILSQLSYLKSQSLILHLFHLQFLPYFATLLLKHPYHLILKLNLAIFSFFIDNFLSIFSDFKLFLFS